MLVQPLDMTTAATEFIGEPVRGGVWFLTEPTPWYHDYPGTSVIVLDLFLFLVVGLFIAYDRAFNNMRKRSTALGHSGAIFCVRTSDELVFIASEHAKGSQQLAKILRRFPERTLVSCNFDHSHKTKVDFVFAGGDSFSLQFEGVWSDLAEFFRPGSAIAHPLKDIG